jgi:hypothetical protein
MTNPATASYSEDLAPGSCPVPLRSIYWLLGTKTSRRLSVRAPLLASHFIQASAVMMHSTCQHTKCNRRLVRTACPTPAAGQCILP